MSVFHEIDRLKAKFDADLGALKRQVRELKGGAVRADELGWWRCSFRPPRGDRHVQRLQARSPAELLEQLKQLVAKYPPKRKRRDGAE